MENEVQIQSLVKKLLNIYNACKWSNSKLHLRKKKFLPKTKKGELTSELDTEIETRCHQRNIFVFTQTLPGCGKLNSYLTDPRKTKSSYSLLKDYTSQSSSTDLRNDSSYQWLCRCDSSTSDGHTYGNYHSVNVCTCPSCCCKRKKKYGTVDKKSITDIKGVKNTTITVSSRQVKKADETTLTNTDESKEIQVPPENAASTTRIMNTSHVSPTGPVGCDCKCEFNRRSVACQSSPAPCRVCSTISVPDSFIPISTAPRKSIQESHSSSSCTCSCESPNDINGGGCKCCPTGTATSCRQTCSLTPNKKCCCNKSERKYSLIIETQRDKIIIPRKYSIEDKPSQNLSLVLSEDVEKELLHESYRDTGSLKNQGSGELRPNGHRIEVETIGKRAVEGLQSSPTKRRSVEVSAKVPYMEELPKDFFRNMKSCECSCPRCRKKVNTTQTNQIFENRIKDYYADFSQCLRNMPNNSQNRYLPLNRSSEIGTIDEGVNTYNNVVVQTYTSSMVEQHSSDRLQIGPCQQRNECCTCGKKVPPGNETIEDHGNQYPPENYAQPRKSISAFSPPRDTNEEPFQNQTNSMPPVQQQPAERSTRSPSMKPSHSALSHHARSPEMMSPENSFTPHRPPSQLYDRPADPWSKGAVNCCCCNPEEIPRGERIGQVGGDDFLDSVGDGIGDGDPFPGLTDDTKEEIRDLLKSMEDNLLKEARLHKRNMTGIMKQLSKQAGEIKELKVHVKGVVESKRAITCEEVEKKIRKMDDTKKKEAKKRKEEKKKPKKDKETKEHQSGTCCKCDKKNKKSIGCCGQCCANRCCGCCGTCCGGCCVDFCDCCCAPCEKICPCCCGCAECCDTCWSCGCFSSGGGNNHDGGDAYHKCKCR